MGQFSVAEVGHFYIAANNGPVFRRIRRNQKLGEELLTGDGFYKLLKKLCTEAGIESKNISPHSLRAGFITSATWQLSSAVSGIW